MSKVALFEKEIFKFIEKVDLQRGESEKGVDSLHKWLYIVSHPGAGVQGFVSSAAFSILKQGTGSEVGQLIHEQAPI